MRTHKQLVKVQDVIAKAIELLGPGGQYWITGDEHVKQGDERQDTFCMVGVLDKAAGELHASLEVEQRAFVAVAQELPEKYSTSRDDYSGQFESNLEFAADNAREAIPRFNDSLPSTEALYEDVQGNLRFKRSRRPKGFKQVKSVFCKALKKTVAKDI